MQVARASDWFVLFALTVFWGSAFLFTELALEAFPPAVLVAARLAIAMALILAVLLLSGRRLPRHYSSWIRITVMAMLGSIVPFNLIAWGQQHIDSGLTAILMAVMPLFVLLLSHFFIAGERLNPMRLAGFSVGFLGVVLVVGPELDGLGSGSQSIMGMLAVLAAALSYSAGAVYARRLGQQEPLVLSAGMLLVASAFTAPLALQQLPLPNWTPDLTPIAAVLILSVICTALATFLFFRLVQGPGPAFVSIVNYLVPAFAVVIGAMILGETIPLSALQGLALILGGIAVSEGGQRLKQHLRRRTTMATNPEEPRVNAPRRSPDGYVS